MPSAGSQLVFLPRARQPIDAAGGLIVPEQEQGDHLHPHGRKGSEGFLDLVAVVPAHVDHRRADAVLSRVQGQEPAQQVHLLADAGKDQHQIHRLHPAQIFRRMALRQDPDFTEAGHVHHAPGAEDLHAARPLRRQEHAVFHGGIDGAGKLLPLGIVKVDGGPIVHVVPLEQDPRRRPGPGHGQSLTGGQGEAGGIVVVRQVPGEGFPACGHGDGVGQIWRSRPLLRPGGDGGGQQQQQQQYENARSLGHMVRSFIEQALPSASVRALISASGRH